MAEILEVSKLSFASSGDLNKFLGVDPGAVTLLGVANDKSNLVQVVVDDKLWGRSLQCHPLVNTATLVINSDGIERFLRAQTMFPRSLKLQAG